MFDVGFSELVVIGLVALVVLGPKRLPETARAAGRWAARIRRFVSEVKQDLDREMHDAELTELRQLKQELDQTRQVMQETSGELAQSFTAAASAIRPNAAENSATDSPPSAPVPPPAAEKPAPRAKASRAVKSTKKSKTGKKHGAARRHARR